MATLKGGATIFRQTPLEAVIVLHLAVHLKSDRNCCVKEEKRELEKAVQTLSHKLR